MIKTGRSVVMLFLIIGVWLLSGCLNIVQATCTYGSSDFICDARGSDTCTTVGTGSVGTAYYNCGYSSASGCSGCYVHVYECDSACGAPGSPGDEGGGYAFPTCTGGKTLQSYTPQGYLNLGSCQFMGTCGEFFPSYHQMTGCGGVASKGICSVSYLCCNPNEVISCSTASTDTYEIESTVCPEGEMKVSARTSHYFTKDGVRVSQRFVTCRRNCGCVPTCAATAPVITSIVQGASATAATINWTPGLNGASQLLRVDEDLAEVNAGCPTLNDCEVKTGTLSSATSTYPVTGLLPQTTYYFRVVNYSNASCYQSAVGTYTTPANNTLSGIVYYDPSNNCTGTPWNAGTQGSLTVSTSSPVYSGSVGNDGRFSFSTGATTSIASLSLSSLPAGYSCSTGTGCNNSCTLTNVTSPSSSNYFYISQSREAWWQAVGGSIYSAGSVRSEIPSASEHLIAVGPGGALGALMRASGTVDTGNGAISTEGYSAQTTFKGKTMNYDFFAAHVGVTSSTTNDWGADTMNKPASGEDFYYINPASSEATVSTPWTVANGESYVVFVNGDLRIASNVVVQPGGFLAFIVNGSVRVSPATTSMQGLYVIDGTFASETNAGTDSPLAVEGSVIAWGGVALGRDLVGGNNSTPAESFTYRPDLVANMPENMKVFALKWEEVVPGTFE